MSAHVRYLSYVIRHKWFVLIAGVRVGAPLWRLVIHDWSKFTPGEWFPYVRNFYGLSEDEWRKRESSRLMPSHGFIRRHADETAAMAWCDEANRRRAAFDRAWLHHQHASPHHWQHWILRNDDGSVRALPMPRPLVREMVADWMGAGRAITGRWEVAEWYAKSRDKIALHPDTQTCVERIIASLAAPPCTASVPARASGEVEP